MSVRISRRGGQKRVRKVAISGWDPNPSRAGSKNWFALYADLILFDTLFEKGMIEPALENFMDMRQGRSGEHLMRIMVYG